MQTVIIRLATIRKEEHTVFHSTADWRHQPDSADAIKSKHVIEEDMAPSLSGTSGKIAGLVTTGRVLQMKKGFNHEEILIFRWCHYWDESTFWSIALFPAHSFPLESRIWAQTMNNEFLQVEKKQLVPPGPSVMLTDSNLYAPLGWQHKAEMHATLTISHTQMKCKSYAHLTTSRNLGVLWRSIPMRAMQEVWGACVHCGKADLYILFCNSGVPKPGTSVNSWTANTIHEVPAVTLSSCILNLNNLVPDPGDFSFERHAKTESAFFTTWLTSPS